jgi:hypothetical protein
MPLHCLRLRFSGQLPLWRQALLPVESSTVRASAALLPASYSIEESLAYLPSPPRHHHPLTLQNIVDRRE